LWHTEKHNKLRDKKHKDADSAFHKAQNEEDKMNRKWWSWGAYR
jgi:hypothetical protein